MAHPTPPPVPPDDTAAEPPGMSDPRTGGPMEIGDMRAEFERLSRQVPRAPEAERAFIEGKIEMIRTDPTMSDAEKERAIAALRGE